MAQSLYRFYDREGSLLYVGVTLDPPARFRSHSHVQNWWDRVADIRLEPYPDRASVLTAERDAIKRERPHYNVTHNLPDASVTPLGSITWVCEQCKRMIRPTTGYIYVTWQDIHEYEAERKRWEARTEDPDGFPTRSLADLLDMPAPARWHVQHRKCDPDPEASSYWFDVGDCSTPSEALDWAAHLFEKNWIQATDFEALLRKLAYELRPSKRGKAS